MPLTSDVGKAWRLGCRKPGYFMDRLTDLNPEGERRSSMKKVAQSVVVSVFFILVLVLAAASFVSAAREGDSPDDAIVMETVVVTATKTPEKRRDIPNAVVIVDKKDIQAVGAGSIGALLANEPGIDWQTYGNYGGATQEIHIRGMRGNATQVLVNGVAINSP